MEDLHRIRRFTLDYQDFPGLRILPLGLLFILIALQQLNVIPWLGQQGNLSISLPALLVAIILWLLIDRVYKRGFGRVDPLKNRSALSGLNITLLIAMIGIIVLENILFRQGNALPFSMMGLFIGLVIFITGIYSRRRSYILGGFILMAASFFPLIMGVDNGDPIFGSIGSAYSFLLGCFMVISGILDHYQFVRTLSATERDGS